MRLFVSMFDVNSKYTQHSLFSARMPTQTIVAGKATKNPLLSNLLTAKKSFTCRTLLEQ